MITITQKVVEFLIGSLRAEIMKRGFSRVVVGLSGGVDSAAVSLLCKGIEGVDLKALVMPSSNTPQQSVTDAINLCDSEGLNFEVIPIKGFDQLFCKSLPFDQRSRGNFNSRMRMTILYHTSLMENRLVIGTSNRSELMLGYGTIFGDLACAINPIGDLYKTQVYQLARILGVPEEILEKRPSAELYEGQSDEEELGYPYPEIDRFLDEYTACGGNVSSMIDKRGEYYREMVESLSGMIRKNSFKLKLPHIVRVEAVSK